MVFFKIAANEDADRYVGNGVLGPMCTIEESLFNILHSKITHRYCIKIQFHFFSGVCCEEQKAYK